MKIRVIIADDIQETRENIKTLLSFDNRLEVIGEARDGEEAIVMAREKHPDIMLMDINMPKKDGIRATEEITMQIPGISIIIMSVQGDREYLKSAMSAGARDYIVKPFTSDELINTIGRVYTMEQQRRDKLTVSHEHEKIKTRLISVFSTKGGVGKTTIATNLAVAIARQTKKKVALLDFDLLFGDVAVHLNVSVKTTLTDVIKNINNMDENLLDEYMVTHFSGIRVLPAPSKPEYAEFVNAQHIEKVLGFIRGNYHYVVMDLAQNFNETTLAALDVSDTILFVSTMDLPTIKNVKTGMDVMESLRYTDDKVKIILNKATEQYGISFKDFEETIHSSIWSMLPEDSSTVIQAANKGLPFVVTRPEAKVSRGLEEMAGRLTDKQQNAKPLFKKILGL